MRRRTWTVIAVAAVLAGCGGTEEAQRSVEDDTLVVALPSQPENLNPIASDNVYEGNQPFFNGLLRYAKDLTPVPDLAAGMPTRSADGLRVVVRLRDGVRFHDGKPLTAKDVAFTYNAILDKDSASPLATLLDSLLQARATAPLTVEFRLKRVDPAFYDKLQVGIVPAHLLAGKDLKTAAFNRRPVGTGPYVIKEFQPGGRIVMEANRDYFRGAPAIKRIVQTAVPDENARVALLEKGTIDAAGIVPKLAERVRRNGNYTVLEIPTADARTAALPTRDPILRDPAIRRALSFAVDREQLVTGALAGAGEPAYGPIMKGHWAYSPVAETRYDPAEAERRLDAAGWQRAGDGPRVRAGKHARLHAHVPRRRQRAQGHRARRRLRPGQGRRPGEARGADLRRDREAPGPGRDGVRLRPPVRPRHRALLAPALEVRDRRGRLHELPAHPQPRGRQRARRRARHARRTKRKEAYARLQAEHAKDASWLWLVRLRHIVAISKRVSGVDPQVEPHAHGFSRGTTWNLEDWTLGPAR